MTLGATMALALAGLCKGDEKKEAQADDTQNTEGYILDDVNMNDMFEFLTKETGRKYTRVPELDGKEYLISGHLNDGDPIQQIKDAAFLYGVDVTLTIYEVSVETKAKFKDKKLPRPDPNAKKPIANEFIYFPHPDEGKSLEMNDVDLNRMVQYLAKEADLQYFHNAVLSTPNYQLDGSIREDKPMEIIREIADLFQLRVHKTKHTLYLLTKEQYELLVSDE